MILTDAILFKKYYRKRRYSEQRIVVKLNRFKFIHIDLFHVCPLPHTYTHAFHLKLFFEIISIKQRYTFIYIIIYNFILFYYSSMYLCDTNVKYTIERTHHKHYIIFNYLL